MFIKFSQKIPSHKLLQLGQRIINTIFPPQCINCNEFVMDNLSLCSECWQQLEFINDNCCTICANYMGEIDYSILGETLLCHNCQTSSPFFDKVIAVSYFNEIMEKIVYEFKFKDQPQLALFFNKLLKHKLFPFIQDIDLIIPIPLSFRRLLKRQYNQAALLSRLLNQTFSRKFSLSPLLIREKHTIPQNELNYKQRKTNISNAFKVVKPELIKGKNILLIDDIVTTSSTINEAAKVLKSIGANKVMIGAISRVKLRSY